MRPWLRRRSFWVSFQRLRREGFTKAFRRWRRWQLILRTPPVRTRHSGGTELHLLCYRNDYLCALWSLKTFYHYARVDVPLWIHIQGEAPARVVKRLRAHFPNAHIVAQREADAFVIPKLQAAGWERLLAARQKNPYVLKLTDFLLLGNAPNLLTLDSDVLFFREPAEFLSTPEGHLFQRDLESTYVLSSGYARKQFGIAIAPQVNVGMMHFRRDRVSLARCDEYLESFPTWEGWLEQTLYALLAGEKQDAEYLPREYLISLESGLDYSGLTARHYAGPSRHLLHEEGIPYLLRRGFTAVESGSGSGKLTCK